MAFSYQILGQDSPSASTNLDLYTVPASTQAIGSTLVICNTNSSTVSVRVAARKAGAPIATKHYILYGSSVPANDMITLTMGMSLDATDIVTVWANTTGVSFTLFGTAIT